MLANEAFNWIPQLEFSAIGSMVVLAVVLGPFAWAISKVCSHFRPNGRPVVDHGEFDPYITYHLNKQTGEYEYRPIRGYEEGYICHRDPFTDEERWERRKPPATALDRIR